jgi:hypothetical protein
MKATGKLLAAALIAGAAGAISIDVQAAEGGARGPRGDVGALGGRHHGDHSRGHGHRHWGHRHWYPSWGFYFGAPLIASAWGWPYYDYWYGYGGPRVVYRDVLRDSYPEGVMVGPPVSTTEVPRGDGAPTQGPLYMNYCESAKAYFPKVTSCPEGWRLATPAS